MPQTPRERVLRCLDFERPDRIPRHTWALPWAMDRYPEVMQELARDFPDDIAFIPSGYHPSPVVQGQPTAVGAYVDEWGCRFQNVQEGVIGEVREPILSDLADLSALRPPYELMPEDRNALRDQANRACADSERFILAPCLPRPWERMQFLHGTAQSMMSLAIDPEGSRALLQKIHDFHMHELEFWVRTDIDGIFFMDDWGSQTSLLIDPALWREVFKPLYRDYCDIAHTHGKKAFMHSDGHIEAIYPDLIEIGLDAINSQLFIMDLDTLRRCAKGKITFWGEIDRQHVMGATDPDTVRAAVRRVAEALYDPAGGIIAQFEFGPGAHPANPRIVHEEWQAVQARQSTGKNKDGKPTEQAL